MQKQNCIHPCTLLFAQKTVYAFVNVAHNRADNIRPYKNIIIQKKERQQNMNKL
jgi:hypothetical protein